MIISYYRLDTENAHSDTARRIRNENAISVTTRQFDRGYTRQLGSSKDSGILALFHITIVGDERVKKFT